MEVVRIMSLPKVKEEALSLPLLSMLVIGCVWVPFKGLVVSPSFQLLYTVSIRNSKDKD